SGMVRSIKWNQEDALVARRFKQELAPSMGSMGLVRMVHDRLATAGKEEQARLCIWTVKRADTQALLTIISLIQSGAYKQLVKHQDIKWNQEDALVARRFKQELAPSMGSMGLVRMVHDRLATAGKEEQARLCIWTVKRADTQALLTILSLIQSGAYKQLVKHQDIKWNQEDALVARRFKQELAPSMGSMGLVRMVHDRLATAGKEEQARLCIWTVKRADTQALLTILSLIQSGAYKQLKIKLYEFLTCLTIQVTLGNLEAKTVRTALCSKVFQT
ncbi:hypothetical protein HID58_092861, partial [Brassica napus]